MRTTEQPGPSYEYLRCDCPAELLPSAVAPSLRAIFALSKVAISGLAEDQPYGAEAYRINMPPLWASHQRGEPSRAFSNPEERFVTRRAKQILAAPYVHERPAEIDDRELLHVQAWLDGVAGGTTEQEIAKHLEASHKHVVTAGRWLRGRLGARNQTSTMYSALLFGYIPDVSASPSQEAPASHYERLHLYFDAVGFTAALAARLTRPDAGLRYADTISSARGKIRKDFGASSSAQVIFFAFQTGHFKRLPPPQP